MEDYVLAESEFNNKWLGVQLEDGWTLVLELTDFRIYPDSKYTRK